MVQFITLYQNGADNETISASGQETFGNTNADRKGKGKHGSYNFLTVTQSGTGAYSIKLDGLDNRKTKLPSTGSYVIKAEEGIYFDFIVVTDESGSGISAGDISLEYGKAVVVQQ